VSKRLLRNYHYSLHNSPEESISHLLRGGSLKSRKMQVVVYRGIQRMCNVKCMIMSIIDAAARIVTKCLKNDSEQFQENI
jgi:hypothetical protein